MKFNYFFLSKLLFESTLFLWLQWALSYKTYFMLISYVFNRDSNFFFFLFDIAQVKFYGMIRHKSYIRRKAKEVYCSKLIRAWLHMTIF